MAGEVRPGAFAPDLNHVIGSRLFSRHHTHDGPKARTATAGRPRSSWDGWDQRDHEVASPSLSTKLSPLINTFPLNHITSNMPSLILALTPKAVGYSIR